MPTVTMNINGRQMSANVENRTLLVAALREDLNHASRLEGLPAALAAVGGDHRWRARGLRLGSVRKGRG